MGEMTLKQFKDLLNRTKDVSPKKKTGDGGDLTLKQLKRLINLWTKDLSRDSEKGMGEVTLKQLKYLFKDRTEILDAACKYLTGHESWAYITTLSPTDLKKAVKDQGCTTIVFWDKRRKGD